jgi:hypothetical protein
MCSSDVARVFVVPDRMLSGFLSPRNVAKSAIRQIENVRYGKQIQRRDSQRDQPRPRDFQNTL